MPLTPPPTNPTPPYGPIDLLPELSSFQQRTVLKVTFPLSPTASEPASAILKDDKPNIIATNSGSKISWKETQSRPSVAFVAETENVDATYTIIMTDPDAPTPHDTKYAYWRHWIQPGLRPSTSPLAEAHSDRAPLTEYLAPGKKEPSADPHRYLVLLYHEPGPDHPYHSLTKTDVGEEHFEARRAFDAKTWIQQNELELVAVEWFWGTG